MTKLAKALQQQGRKKLWVAEQLNVDRSTVTRWVKGQTKPRRKYQVQLARLLNIPVEELFN